MFIKNSKVHILNFNGTNSLCSNDFDLNDINIYSFSLVDGSKDFSSWDILNKKELCMECYKKRLPSQENNYHDGDLLWWYRLKDDKNKVVYSPVEKCRLKDHEEAIMSDFVSIDGEPWEHTRKSDK